MNSYTLVSGTGFSDTAANGIYNRISLIPRTEMYTETYQNPALGYWLVSYTGGSDPSVKGWSIYDLSLTSLLYIKNGGNGKLETGIWKSGGTPIQGGFVVQTGFSFQCVPSFTGLYSIDQCHEVCQESHIAFELIY